jgi:hypothetical protein
MAKSTADRNVWYSFMFDVFLDGRMSHWGRGKNILHYLMHPEIMRVIAAIHDFLPLVTYQFVFMLPLWRTPPHTDRLQFLVNAIHTNHYLPPKPNRFMQLLWALRCEKPECNVDEVAIVNKETGEK